MFHTCRVRFMRPTSAHQPLSYNWRITTFKTELRQQQSCNAMQTQHNTRSRSPVGRRAWMYSEMWQNRYKAVSFRPVKLTGVKQSEKPVPLCSVCGSKRSGSCHMSKGEQVHALPSILALVLRACRIDPHTSCLREMDSPSRHLLRGESISLT